MGISADLILFTEKKTEDYFLYDWLTKKNKKLLEEIYPENTFFFFYRTIFYIGNSSAFTENILNNYNENEGLIHIKEAYPFIVKKEKFEKKLTDFFKIPIEYILENKNLFVNLNY